MKFKLKTLAAMTLVGALSFGAYAQNVVLKASDTHPTGYSTVMAVESTGKKLDAATNGRIKIQMFAGGVLGQEK